MCFGRTLIQFLAIIKSGFIKQRAVLHKDCTELNYIYEGKIWQLLKIFLIFLEFLNLVATLNKLQKQTALL